MALRNPDVRAVRCAVCLTLMFRTQWLAGMR
jgi:hypothetical protein